MTAKAPNYVVERRDYQGMLVFHITDAITNAPVASFASTHAYMMFINAIARAEGSLFDRDLDVRLVDDGKTIVRPVHNSVPH